MFTPIECAGIVLVYALVMLALDIRGVWDKLLTKLGID